MSQKKSKLPTPTCSKGPKQPNQAEIEAMKKLWEAEKLKTDKLRQHRDELEKVEKARNNIKINNAAVKIEVS